MKFIENNPKMFINNEFIKELTFNPKGFDFFLDQIMLTDDSKEQVRIILAETEHLPAALGNYHGCYKGGLHDHILLVANLVSQILTNNEFLKPYITWLKENNLMTSHRYDEINKSKAILTAIYHDFGKVPYYAFRLQIPNRVIITKRTEREDVTLEIHEKFHYKGRDPHVDRCIAVLKRYNLPFDEDIYQAIIFHHGVWAKYTPFEPTTLSHLIHVADMIASQFYKI
ncbi:MAG: HD domain-containing protein [Candidatus Hermodarchaeota archaeon]